jgi:hypothetical protein
MKSYFPQSAANVLPLIGAGLGFRAIRQRSASKTVNRAMLATAFGSLLTGPIVIFYVPAVIALVVAGAQVRKQEMIDAAAAEPVDDAEDAYDDDDVIDVDEVDGDVIEVDEVEDDPEDEPRA